MNMKIRGAGSSQSSQPRTPIEAPDSLHSIAFARVLDLVSEGEIAGLVNGLNSIYLDETPIANVDESLNFKNVQVDTRNGTQDQEYIRGFPAVENEVTVGVELRSETPWVQAITNVNLSAVRLRLSVLALSKANPSNGDVNGHSVQFAIDVATDGGAYSEVIRSAFTGKTTTKYERGFRIDLPDATTGWMLRVRRITPNADSLTTADITYVEAYTEIVDGKFRYPNSAIVAVKVDAEQFRSVPRRAYHMRGRIIQVPSNYNAETREYTGIWDGTFQPAYSNNPAWVFYDLVLAYRYGLGHLVDATMIDKWRLYEIGRYCDELVDDGNGGEEPRFTCNIYLQREADAYKVLQDLVTVFRGITFWGGGTINAVADMPGDPVYCYTNASVIDGKFTYQGSSRKTRFNVALVSWNNLADFGRAKIEYVPDEESIVRYGIQQTEIIAVGCTSQGQARRIGKWLLATARYETQTVSFRVGLEGVIAAPGQHIQIADAHKAGRRIGGRVSSSTINDVTVDSLPVVVPGDTITCMLPTGISQQRTVASVVGRTISVTAPFNAAPVPQGSWLVESESLNAQHYKVISVVPADSDGAMTFVITAIQHNESKFAYVEDGTPIEVPAITTLPGNVQFPPDGAEISHRFIATYDAVQTIVTIDFEPVEGAATYEISYRMNSGAWTNTVEISDTTYEIVNVPEGIIEARINAVNNYGRRSVPIKVGPYDVPEAPPRSELPAVLLPIVGGVITVDCAYDYFRVELNANVTNVVFVNVPLVKTIIIEVVQQGAFTFAFPVSVQPVSGTPYVPSQSIGALDVLGLSTINTGALWKLLVSQPGAGEGGALGVSVSPTSASDTEATDGVTPSAPSVSVTATVGGGVAPVTVAWARADGAGGANFLIDNAASLTPTFSIASGTTAYPSTTQTWRVTATDADGVVASFTVPITLERTAPAGDVLGLYDGEVAQKVKLAFAPAEAIAIAQIMFRRNGTWETSRANPYQLIDSNNWISGPEADSGDAYRVRFTPTLTDGPAAFVNNGAPAFAALTSDRSCTLTVTQSFPGATSSTYSVLVEIEEASNPGVVISSGTVTLIASAEQA